MQGGTGVDRGEGGSPPHEFCLRLPNYFIVLQMGEGDRAVTAPEISIDDRSYVLVSKSLSVNERQLQLLEALPTNPPGCCVDRKSDRPPFLAIY